MEAVKRSINGSYWRNRFGRWWLVGVMWMLQASPNWSQSTAVMGIFPTIDHVGKISEKTAYELYYFAAAPLRRFDENQDFPTPSVLLWYAEQSITHSFSSQWSGTLSYVYQAEGPTNGSRIQENRLYGQISYSHSRNRHQWKHRWRHDSRFFQDDFKHRIRYQLSYKYTWGNGHYLLFGQEFFGDLTAGAKRLYNENWANGGVGLKCGERQWLELGALYVTWHTGNGNWFHQFYFQPTWTYVIDFDEHRNR
jgi:hypothetical protein